MWKILALPIIFALFFWGCKSAPDTEKKEEIEYATTPSGLKYVDLKTGSGPEPKPGQRVFVNQIVSIDGTEIENTYETGQPFDFVLGEGETIDGLEEGVSTMKTGGIRRLYVPPDLGFGRRAVRTIPKNSTLIIEVELLKIQ